MNTNSKNDGRGLGEAGAKPRKVIQIAPASSDEYGADFYALCDDGSIWVWNFTNNVWSRWKNIPQDESAAKEAK